MWPFWRGWLSFFFCCFGLCNEVALFLFGSVVLNLFGFEFALKGVRFRMAHMCFNIDFTNVRHTCASAKFWTTGEEIKLFVLKLWTEHILNVLINQTFCLFWYSRNLIGAPNQNPLSKSYSSTNKTCNFHIKVAQCQPSQALAQSLSSFRNQLLISQKGPPSSQHQLQQQPVHFQLLANLWAFLI